jgi:hypothetical protein
MDAQENVRKAIESMTGLHVVRVDVHVQGVSFEKENNALQSGVQKAALEAGKAEQEKLAEPEKDAEPEENPEPEKKAQKQSKLKGEKAKKEQADKAEDEKPAEEV